MPTPSFARATAASSSKASPKGGAPNPITAPPKTSPNNPTKTPTLRTSLGSPLPAKKLKRPSTLTKRVRKSIAYNADLYFIKPAIRSKPCPLADLPSELRTEIYSHVFGDLQKPILVNYGRVRHAPPALLHICRAMRIEAAYMYFPEASFTWIVKNLNFTMVIRWLQSLQLSHRTLLSRNPNLTVEMFPSLSKSFTYPPKDFLLDDTLENHWKFCQPFGNLYTIKGIHSGPHGHRQTHWDDLEHSTSQQNMRMYFIFFCRLGAWARLRNQAGYSNVQWRYVFDMPTDRNSVHHLCETLSHYETGLSRFLVQLKTFWSRNQNARIKQPILELIDCFIDAITEMTAKSSDSTFGMLDLCGRLMILRERIENWDR
ncbi:hypothetical protein E8E12_008988 [Didymella heteroderae]|uniref:Uncharacterized protein n=1 Tax=Didymella heteroderae TaxID=1769908 RepID=A0A9P5C332_9PLEO|nr:hypothetical protein E8E12_008988 [Didymella heteroderae]